MNFFVCRKFISSFVSDLRRDNASNILYLTPFQRDKRIELRASLRRDRYALKRERNNNRKGSIGIIRKKAIYRYHCSILPDVCGLYLHLSDRYDLTSPSRELYCKKLFYCQEKFRYFLVVI